MDVVDLASLNKAPVIVPWQVFPTMEQNPDFAAQLERNGVQPKNTIIFMCRSGNRSRSAAQAMTEHGFAHCFNMSDGFEGPHDERRHRGTVCGWKARDLPWAQG